MTTIETPHTPEELLQLVKGGQLKAARFENVAGELVVTIEFWPALEQFKISGAEIAATARLTRQILDDGVRPRRPPPSSDD